jgi:hypothetical protein
VNFASLEGIKVFVEQSMRDAYLQFLVECEILDEVQALDVLERQRQDTPPVGRLALVENYMTMKEITRVVKALSDTDMRFGEMAIQMGYLKTTQLLVLLDIQRKKRPGLNKIIVELGLSDEVTLKTLQKVFLSRIRALVT